MNEAAPQQPWLAPGRMAAALEGSQRPASVALAGADGGALEFHGAGSHGSDLLPLLAAELASRGLGPGSLQRLVVGLGPGSFTGLRVVSAQVQGLALALGLEPLGLASIEARLCGALAPGDTGLLLADARGGLFTLGRYARLARDIEPLDAVAAAPAAATLELLQRWAREAGPGPRTRWFAEAGAVSALGPPAGDLPAFEPAPPASARALLSLAQARFETQGPGAFAGPQPLYLAEFWVRPRR